jgi:hypothetical protein
MKQYLCILALLLAGCFGPILRLPPQTKALEGQCFELKKDWFVEYVSYPVLIIDPKIRRAELIDPANADYHWKGQLQGLTVAELWANPLSWKKHLVGRCVNPNIFTDCPIGDVELLPKGTKIRITDISGSWDVENGDHYQIDYEFLNFTPRHDLHIPLERLFQVPRDRTPSWQKEMMDRCK